ncbi:MAG: ATP-binding protein, partial [Steroidobacteraceae bacterium]
MNLPRSRVLLAVGLSIAAVLLQWLVEPLVAGRAPFLFFLPAILLAAAYGGPWPAVLVSLVGAITGALSLRSGSADLLVRTDPASWSILAFGVIASALVFLGYRLFGAATHREQAADALAAARVELRQQLSDLSELHELTGRLESTPELRGQLEAVLLSSARLLDSRRGVISLRSPGGQRLLMEASFGLSDAAKERLSNVAYGAELVGLPCHSRQRVHIADVESDVRAEPFRDFAREEGFRSVQVTPLLDHDGELLGCIAILIEDARELSAREARLADLCAHKATIAVERTLAERLAREHDRRFRSVLDGSAAGFTVFRPLFDDAGNVRDFIWVYINPAAAAVWRKNPEHFVGRPVSSTLPGAMFDSAPFDRFASVLRDNVVQEFEHETRLTPTREWFHVIVSPLDGDVAVWFTNVTARRRNEEALVEADQRKDEFLATLAHELRNPLAPIRQATQIAMAPQATESQKRWSYAVVERQVQHMSLLLDDLLDISRITRGQLRLRRQACELHEVFNAGVEAARPLIDRKGHTLDLDLPAAPIFVDADPLRLAQILSNLLTNAAKYTNVGGNIRVSARVDGADLEIEVADNGIGIESTELSGVFTMFSQVTAAHERSEGGLGIGLALTRGLVQLHGGTIEAASQGSGQGAEFTARLPIVTSTQVAAPREDVALEPQARLLRRRLVIADDNRDAAESLAMLMRLHGNEVHLAHDGRAAIDAIDRFQPDA